MTESQDTEYEQELARLYGVDSSHNLHLPPVDDDHATVILSQEILDFLREQGEVRELQ